MVMVGVDVGCLGLRIALTLHSSDELVELLQWLAIMTASS